MRATAAMSSVASLRLTDPTLLVSKGYIGGAWVGADAGGTVDVLDPASGGNVGSVPDMGAAETRRAIEAAEAALSTASDRTR